MSRWFTALCSLVLVVLLTSACSQRQVEPPSADEDWQELISGAPDVAQRPGEEDFVHYVRNVQLDLLWVREKGLEFWDNHPDDERRYWWLAITANTPPAYAVNLEEWAEQELELGPNTAAIDYSAVADWNEAFARLKGELAQWGRPPYSNQIRRLVWAGELDGAFMQIRRSKALGDAVDTAAFIEDFLAFAAAFPEPESERDIEDHEWSLIRFTRHLAQPDILNLSVEEERVLAQRLIDTGSNHAVRVGGWMLEGLQQPPRLPRPPWPREPAHAPLEQYMPEGGDWHWRFLLDTPPSGDVLSLIRLSVPRAPMYENFGQVHSRGVSLYHNTLSSLRYRNLLVQYWDQLTWDERADALRLSCARRPRHLENLIALMFDGETQFLSGATGANLDKDARLFEALESRAQAALESGHLSLEQADRLLATDFLCRMQRVRQEWTSREDPQHIIDLAEHAAQILDNGQSSPSLANAVLSFVREISREEGRERYGFTSTELSAMIEPFLDAADEPLRLAAEGFVDRVELRPGVPVAIQAPTLEGELFDTADLQGKIVLIDHWDTQCAPCIAAMPSLHETYLEYKDRGFEILSIAYDATSQRRRVERLKDELGLTWTTLDGEGLWGGVSVKYGLSGFPSYMLLDREGNFVAGNDELRQVENIPGILDRILAEEESQAATP